MARYQAKEAQRKAWEEANVEKAVRQAAARAKKELKRQAQAAQAGTALPEKKSGMPKEPVAGPRPSDQVNFTDEESRIMPVSGGGFDQCYNSQAVVAEDTMLIMAAFVTQETNDKKQVAPMLKALGELTRIGLPTPEAIALDTGFHSAANVDASLAAGIEPLIAASRENHHPSPMERFVEPPPLQEDATPVQKMAHELRTVAGKKRYALRKQTVEPVFGIIKSVMGFCQFSMLGLTAAENEWNMVCLSWNLKRMAVLSLN